MVTSNVDASEENEGALQHFELPSLSESEATILKGPAVLLQYCEGKRSAYLIAGMGCQRQVACESWLARAAVEIRPLAPLAHDDECRFSFNAEPRTFCLPRGCCRHRVDVLHQFSSSEGPATYAKENL